MSSTHPATRSTFVDQAGALARVLRDPAFAGDADVAAAHRSLAFLAGHEPALRDLIGFLRIHGEIDPEAGHADALLALPGVRDLLATFPDAVARVLPPPAADVPPIPVEAA